MEIFLVLLPISELLILFSTGLLVNTENTVFIITNNTVSFEKYVKDYNNSDTIYSIFLYKRYTF